MTQRKPGRPSGKRSNREYTQIAGYVKVSTYKEVKKLLIDEEKEFSELLQELLDNWVSFKRNTENI